MRLMSVQASTIEGVYEKIRSAQKHLCPGSDLLGKSDADALIEYLKTNPIEMYHDPEDECES